MIRLFVVESRDIFTYVDIINIGKYFSRKITPHNLSFLQTSDLNPNDNAEIMQKSTIVTVT